MYRANKEDLIMLYKKLRSIQKEIAETIALVEQELKTDNREYNPDEYLKKWVNSFDVHPNLKGIKRGDK